MPLLGGVSPDACVAIGLQLQFDGKRILLPRALLLELTNLLLGAENFLDMMP